VEEGVAITLYRIIQEVFTNILKHSKCLSVDFQMAKTDDRLFVLIKDNGIGFSEEEVASREVEKRGMGLFIIQERVKAINGSLRIHSEVNLGTEVQIEVPLVQS
jgi:signal transduction histidine kinase